MGCTCWGQVSRAPPARLESWRSSFRPSASAAENPPHGPLERMDHEAILTRLEQAKPDVLLVAMGHPKQERWLAMHRDRLTIPLCMGVGASLDLLGGTASRAPLWMQAAGFEWL